MDWLPFAYKIRNKPYGRAREADTDVRGSLAVQVEEISIDVDNPVATIYHQQQPVGTGYGYSSSSRIYNPTAEMTYYRTGDGRLVRPVYFDNGTALTTDLAMTGRMPEGVKGFTDYPVRSGTYGQNPFHLPADDEVSPRIYRITGDDRDDREAEARATAASLLKHDGIYYKEAPEPVVEIQFRGMIKAKSHTNKNSYDKRGLVLKVNAGGIAEVDDDSVLFRLDEYDIAHEIAYEIAANFEKNDPHQFGEVYLADGEKLQFDAYPRARANLGAVLDGMKRNGFGNASVENVRQWCDLVDMMVDGSTSDADVAQAADTFYEAMPRAKHADFKAGALLAAIRRFANIERRDDPELENLVIEEVAGLRP